MFLKFDLVLKSHLNCLSQTALVFLILVFFRRAKRSYFCNGSTMLCFVGFAEVINPDDISLSNNTKSVFATV